MTPSHMLSLALCLGLAACTGEGDETPPPACSALDRTGGRCGDGVVNAPYEDCDDGNTSSCGSCSADCRTVQLAAATGLIVVAAAAGIDDGALFTLGDGSSSPVTFEFDKDSTATGQAVPLASEDASGVATRVRDAINASGLRLSAAAHGALVTIVHQAMTSLGNVPITELVDDQAFYVAGMSGGAGGDCAAEVGCASGTDCASGVCRADTRTCAP